MKKIVTEDQIKQLFKDLDVEYLNDYKIILEDFNPDCRNSDYYLDNWEEFRELEKLYGGDILNRKLADIYISESENKGYGLFAGSSIKEEGFIGVYLGIIKEADEMVEFDDSGYDTDYAWDYPDEVDGFPPLEINAKYAGNELRFANHNENPNLRIEHTVVNDRWYIFFIADRDINKGEELTISYGDAYWDTEYRTLA